MGKCTGSTTCECKYFVADRDKDSTGFTCVCGHMKSDHD